MDRILKLKELLSGSPQDSFLKHALALENIKQGNDGEAERLFNEVLSLEPDYVGSYYHLGKLLERKGAMNEARKVYAKGIEVAEGQSDFHAKNELQNALEDLDD